MGLLETIENARGFLERNGRVSLRVLKLEFALDDDQTEALVEELVDVQQVAALEGKVLSWIGRAPAVDRAPLDYTPRHLADKILQSKSALEGERKVVTVLFADVKSSMELAEQVDPEEWHHILDRFFQILSQGVHRFEGTINQYTGDGIMALFGAPIAHEDHAQRACYAALHLRGALRAYADSLRMEKGLNFSARMGLNSGEVVVGKIGDDLRMDYTAQGHSVGLAQRMEQLADAGQVLVTQHTAGIVEGYFELRDLGETRVKGVSAPVRVSELVGPGAHRARLDRSRARGFSRFVGRSDELAGLEAALERALAGNGEAVGVVAEAGIGKSRLCAEFLDVCRRRGIPVQQATGLPHGRNLPLVPILQLLRDAFGIEDHDAEQTARDKIAGRIVLGDESLTAQLPLVLDFMGVPDPERPAPPLAPEERERQLFDVVRRITRARSRRTPAVWLIEDLHWLDPASDVFVGHLAEAAPGTRTLVLLNFRPEYRPAFAGKSWYQQLTLHPLGPEDLRALLDHLLGSDPSVSALGERIREHTGGNPFFVEEIVNALEDDGTFEGARGSYRLTRPLSELAIPDSVQSLLAARIDRLPGAAKQALQAASVVGSTFARSILGRVAELSDAELDEAVRDLIDAELVFEEYLFPEPEYAFKHPLVREVAYGAQLTERRTRRHAAAARALEEGDPAKLDERASLVAHHWENADEPVAAARWHRRAAIWAGRAQLEESLRHWSRVRELLRGREDSAEAAETLLEASSALRISSRGTLSREFYAELFEESREIARRTDDPRLKVRALTLSGSHRLFAGEAAAAVADLREAYEIGLATDEELIGGVLPMLSVAVAEVEGPIAGVEMIREAERRLGARPDLGKSEIGLSPLPVGLSYCALYLAQQGRGAEARREIERSFEMQRELGDPAALSMINACAANVAIELGDLEAALAHARRAAGSGLDPTTNVAPALALAAAGRWQEAEDVFEEHGAPVTLATRIWATQRARVWHALGQTERALATLRQVCSRGRSTGSKMTELVTCTELVALLGIGAGESARAEIEATLARARELIEVTGARLYTAHLHARHAECLRALGDENAWRRELEEAARLYAEMGATGHAERLARELAS